MKLFKFLFIILIVGSFMNLHAQNVLITDVDNPTEPSIILDPNNPNIMVAGSILNKFHYSNDAGKNWITGFLSSTYGVWGDPVIDVDAYGNFYYFHLSNPPLGNWVDRIVCQKSTNNGVTWTYGTFTGLNGTKVQDKQWSAIDRSNNNIYLTWTQFDDYGSSNQLDSSIILFSKSTDAGVTWSSPFRINKEAGDCIDDDRTVEGAVPAVGPNGEIYVAWAGPQGIVFNRSLDEGNTWLKQEILIDPMPGGWAYNIPGIYRANGLPITKCDTSRGVNNGTIYVNWSDQRNGTDDTDIWLAKSTDAGDTWSDPIRVNSDDTGNQQFFTWMDIDQTNGHLYFVFYDRRNYSDLRTDVYVAISSDGGDTFINKRISASPFIPDSGIFFGDYTNIVAHNDTIRPIWTRLHSGQLSIWTDVSSVDRLLNVSEDITTETFDLKQYPNPASDITYVSFKLHELSTVDIELFDEKGRIIHTLIKDEEKSYGKYIIPVDLENLNLNSGIYFFKITINSQTKVLRSIIIK